MQATGLAAAGEEALGSRGKERPSGTQVSFTLSDMVRNGTNLGQLLNTHALLVRLGRWSSPSFRHSPYDDAALVGYDDSYLAAAQEAGATYFKCGDWRYTPQPPRLGLVANFCQAWCTLQANAHCLASACYWHCAPLRLHSLKTRDMLWEGWSPASPLQHPKHQCLAMGPHSLGRCAHPAAT